MAMTATQPILSERGAAVERHWQELAAKRRMYTGLGAVILIMAVPLLSMRLIAEERRNQTMTFLISAPLSMTQIVLAPCSPFSVSRALRWLRSKAWALISKASWCWLPVVMAQFAR